MKAVFSDRLRQLKDELAATAQEMADQSGIPKRTLEKYMLKSGAASPGIEVIQTICTTFEVSADWLLGLTDKTTQAVSDIEATEVAARVVIEHMIAEINHTQKYVEKSSGGSVFKDGLLYGGNPHELATDYACRVVKLRSEILQGNIGTELKVGQPNDVGKTLNLNPRSVVSTDKI
ncbi:hypothetical protein [Roseinatronobacter sp. NSM]|uniref:hypothetical protein n=1 Tax=Roseinatronobacter sp. NSM TaxID=3457785 RepID=UPI0040362F71